MFRTLRTEIVFAFAALLGLLSLAALINLGKVAVPFVLLAHGFLVWALVKSETDGFFKLKDMPRAGDPQREFHPIQSLMLFLIAIAQVALSAYEVLVG
jgi:hypothetical protein